MLETNCLSLRSPDFSSASENRLLIFLLNIRWNSRYAFSMGHTKPKICIFKLFHCGFWGLQSVSSKIPYILSFLSDYTPTLWFCLKPAYPLKTLPSQEVTNFSSPCITEPGGGRVSFLCLTATSMPFPPSSLWKPPSLNPTSSQCTLLALLLSVVLLSL